MTTTSNRDAHLPADVGLAEPPPKFARRTWLQSAWRELRRARRNYSAVSSRKDQRLVGAVPPHAQLVAASPMGTAKEPYV